jgi:hypothetical protein
MASRLGVSRKATSQFKRMGTMGLDLVSGGILLPDHFFDLGFEWVAIASLPQLSQYRWP